MRSAVVIVSYNKKDLLEHCLFSIFKKAFFDGIVFVVDNGSEDGSVKMIRNNFPDVKVVEMGYNSGFCKANNIGIQKAIDANYDNIILLNNDIEVDDKFFINLIEEIDNNKKMSMVAPKILLFSKKNIIDSAGVLITSDGMGVNRFEGKRFSVANEKKEVFCPAGAAALYTRELLEDIKQDGMFFDESYEYYFEDLDLGWRARLCGWKCIYTPSAIAYHHKHATSGAYSKFIAFYINRNLFYNIIKNYPFIYFCKAVILALFRYPYLFFLAIMHKGATSKFKQNINSINLIILVFRGMCDVAKNFVKLFKKRLYIQKRKVKVDFSVWFKKYGVNFFESKQ